MLLLLPLNSWTPLFSESVRFALVPRQIVEKRLAKYAGNNEQREATLRQMFSDAGCDDQHLSEQSVNGSRAAERHLLAAGKFR